MAKIALVTGASSGIGRYICESLAKRGYNLVIVSRNLHRLREYKQTLTLQYRVKVLPLAVDLAKPNAAEAVYRETQRRRMKIDVLVNDAGFGNFGNYKDTDWHKEHAMMELNMVCLAQMVKLYLPGMVERGYGRILNLSSIAAFQPGPLMAVYYASKAFVLSFSQAVAREVEGTGVTVTALCPGPTDTEFSERANLRKSKIYHYFKDMTAARPAEVAEMGVNAMLRGQTVMTPGLLNKLLDVGSRVLPRDIVTEIVYCIQGKV